MTSMERPRPSSPRLSSPQCSFGGDRSTRRSFLTRASAIATASALFAQVASADDSAQSETPVSIKVDRHRLMRCRMELEVKGNVKVPSDPVQSKKTKTALPVNSTASLDYEERLLSPEGTVEESEVVAAERFYHTASNLSVLNKTSVEHQLRESMRHVIVRREMLPEVVYSPEGYFRHDELSLLKIPVSSVAIDRLLPAQAVIKGDRYELDLESLRSVLNLSTLESGKVEAVVSAIDDGNVRFQIEGDVEGSVDGVSTRMRLLGKMTYDRSVKACTWLAMALHETREISRAEPGFDILAKVRLLRQPLEQPVRLPAEAHVVDFENPPPENRLFVELKSDHCQAAVMMDRRWRMISDDPGQCVMRMVEHDNSIAQCNLRKLTDLPAGKHLTLEAFEADVKRTLGNQLVQLVEADQGLSALGLRILRVVADGETQGVPVRWIMMHFSDDTGKRVHSTFTMAGQKVEDFAGCDAQFGDSLQFLSSGKGESESADPTAQASAEKQTSPIVAEPNDASLELSAPEAEIATKPPQSASDLK